MPVRFWIPMLEVIEEECEIENIIFSEGDRFKNKRDESKTEEDNNDKRVEANGEDMLSDRIKMDENKRDDNNPVGNSANATGKRKNKKEENSADEKNENQRGEGEQNQDGRSKIEHKKSANDKTEGSQKAIFVATRSILLQESVDDSQQNESSTENSIRTGFSITEEEEDDDTGVTVWKHWRMAFCWSDFFYSIIFGLGPTAWDVLSDLKFGWSMARAGDPSSAGLCYLFTALPGFFFLQEVIMLHIFKDCSSKVNNTVVVVTTLVATSAMALGFLTNPLLFQYPATILGCSVVGVKVLGVFVHTPEMKAFSTRVSSFEYSTESSLQLLLLLHLWLSGGPLYLSTILSSLLVIGKCSAEEYLMGNPENLLKDKSAIEKLWLTLKYIPLFSLTAFFRVGAGVIKVGSS